MKDRDGVAVNGGRVKEEHLNNEMKKEKQKNLESSISSNETALYWAKTAATAAC